MTALPARLKHSTRTFGLQTGGSQEREDISVELRVPVQNRVTTWARGDSCLSYRNGPNSVPNLLSNKGGNAEREQNPDSLPKYCSLSLVSY